MREINILGINHSIEIYKPVDNADAMGRWLEKQSKIIIAEGMQEDLTMQTIWHEVVHAILAYIGESDLTNNEDFVTKLSTALNQVADLRIKG